MTSPISALLAALAEAPDRGAYVRLLRDGAAALLSNPAGVADLAASAACARDDAETEAAGALLSHVLDEARMAAENAAPEGARLISAVADALAERDAVSPLAPALRLRLAVQKKSAERSGRRTAGWSFPEPVGRFRTTPAGARGRGR